MGREIDEIKQRLDIVDIISEYVPLKKAGSNFKAPCPFHQEKSPSFMVSAQKQIFHCFGCHKGGDLFTFVQEIEGIDFYETLKILAKKAGVKLEQKQGVPRSQKQALQDVIELATQFYHKVLISHPKAEHARAYASKRKLSKETIESFKIGYAPDSWDALLRFLKQNKVSEATMLKAGLLVQNPEKGTVYDRFRNRFMIPLSDVYGTVVGFTARTLSPDEQGGKYINTPQTEVYDKSALVFGLDLAKQAIKEQGCVVIVEGNMDVISSHQAGVKHVVAVSGTALTQQQLQLLKRFTTKVILSFDSDSAGLAAAKRSAGLALQMGFEVLALELVKGKDPDECINQGVELWQQSIQQALPVIDHFMHLSMSELDLSNPQSKKKITDELLPFIKLIPHKVEQEHYLQKLGQVLNTSLTTLQSELTTAKPTTNYTQNKEEESAHEVNINQEHQAPIEDSALLKAQKELLSLVLRHPALIEIPEFVTELFDQGDLQDLYKSVKSSYDSGIRSGSDLPSALTSPSKEVAETLQLLADHLFSDLEKPQLIDAARARLRYIKKIRLQQKLDAIQIALHQAELKSDQEQIQKLSEEFLTLSQQLSSF